MAVPNSGKLDDVVVPDGRFVHVGFRSDQPTKVNPHFGHYEYHYLDGPMAGNWSEFDRWHMDAVWIYLPD